MLRTCRLFSTSRLTGWATAEGGNRFSQRSKKVEISHFRSTTPDNLELTSMGIGTYSGSIEAKADTGIHNAIVATVKSGVVNLIDTAGNYRYQRSERTVGRALQTLAAEGVNRDEYFLCSKVGFVPEDVDKNEESSVVIDQLVQQGKVPREEFVQGHCMHPGFIKDMVERSLSNLGVETVDLMYLQNPAEAQLRSLGGTKFMEKLAKAFECLEEMREKKKIRYYGLATWKCFRTPPTDEGMHLSLEQVSTLVQKVCGPRHGLHFIQLPINVLMPESFICKWQEFNGTQEVFLNVAKRLQFNVIASSPLLQGHLLDVKLSKTMMTVEPKAARHIQLIRSIPSSSIKSVLIGMRRSDHVLMNSQVAYIDPLIPANFASYLKPEGQLDSKITLSLW